MLNVALMSQYTYRCVLINNDRHGACRCLDLSICNDKHYHIFMYVHFEFYDCLYLIIYTGFFTGMGPMPWTINSEIYPLWARSFSNSVATFTNWSFNLLISMTFLSLSDAITRHGEWCCHYTNINILKSLTLQIERSYQPSKHLRF